MSKLDKRLKYDTKELEPNEGQRDLLSNNKASYRCPSLGDDGFIFSEETIKSLEELGNFLKNYHNSLISEGYTIKDGEIYKNENKQKTNK